MLTISEIVKMAIKEDVLSGDITSLTTVSDQAKGNAIMHMKEDGIASGIEVAKEVFFQVDPQLHVRTLASDGQQVRKGDTLIEVEGKLRSILTAERVALNFMQRMSGIATKTNRFVKLIEEYHSHIVDTRKTTPLLRILEKQAVRDGGGRNHRQGLYDAVMIKDNHIKAAGGITQAVNAARNQVPHTMKIEVEVESFEQLHEALAVGCDIIMLDNMQPSLMAEAVKLIDGRAVVEASGGISEANIVEIARTGVDYISLGALTHSAVSLDIGLDLFEKKVIL